jgi:hypothetical protein
MTDRYDLSRVSRETLERLASAVPRWWSDEEPQHQPKHAPETTEVINAIRAVRSESRVPQRTRSEVDAEIATECREYHHRVTCNGPNHIEPNWDGMTSGWVARMNELCSEPTVEREPERGNPLVRITWQCGSCGWGYFGPLKEECPGCGAEGLWSGSVAPDCKPWHGHQCAPAPGVKATPLPTCERVALLEEIADGLVDMLDGEPSGTDSLDWALERYGYKPTKGVTEADLEAANDADASAPPEAFTSELVRSLQEGNKFLQDQIVQAHAARRMRLAEIYHLTITYGDQPERALLAIRNASGPGS